MTITFRTTEYEFSHGRAPRGGGSWAFQVECTSPEQKSAMMAPREAGTVSVYETGKPEDLQIWANGCATFTEAKARVKRFLRQHFAGAGSVQVTVLP